MPASGTEGDYSGPATIRVTAQNTSIFQDWTVNVTEALNDSTDILTFSIPQETGPATINENNHTVNVEVAYGTDRTQITPVFTLSTGATAVPASGTEGDYSEPATIRVTAQNTSIFQDWTVNISETLNSETDILTYSLLGQTGAADINNGLHTINVEVPYNTNVTNLIAEFGLSPQAIATVNSTTQESGITSNNFTNPVTYVVEAGDGSTQNWTVTVSFAANTETDILTL